MQDQVQEMRKKVSTGPAVLMFRKHVSHSVSADLCFSFGKLKRSCTKQWFVSYLRDFP